MNLTRFANFIILMFFFFAASAKAGTWNPVNARCALAYSWMDAGSSACFMGGRGDLYIPNVTPCNGADISAYGYHFYAPQYVSYGTGWTTCPTSLQYHYDGKLKKLVVDYMAIW